MIATEPTTKTKVCNTCGGDPQPIGNFNRDSDSKDGHSNRCRECAKKYKLAHSIKAGRKIDPSYVPPPKQAVEIRRTGRAVAQCRCGEGIYHAPEHLLDLCGWVCQKCAGRAVR